METFACSPKLLNSPDFLCYCGKIFAYHHPFSTQIECCKSTVNGVLTLFIYDASVKKHKKSSIKAVWDEIHKKRIIICEEITLRNANSCKPDIDICTHVLDEIRTPWFKHLNSKFK